MSAIPYSVPYIVGPPETQSKPNGHEKRRLKNALPRIFFTVSNTPETVTAAILVLACYRLDGGTVIFILGALAALSQPMVLESGMRKHGNLIFELSPRAEMEARSAEALTGGSVNSNFIAFAKTKWCALKLPEKYEHVHLEVPVPQWIELNEQFVLAMGIVPENASNLHEAIGSRVAGTTSEHVDHFTEPPGTTDTDAHSHGEVSCTMSQAASASLNHLQHIAKPMPRGTVTQTYEARDIINALLLSAVIRPGTPLTHALGLAAPFFFGDVESAQMRDCLTHGDVKLPSRAILLQGTVKLDLLAISYERELTRHQQCWRYLSVDASPQYGWNWLISRECRFEFSDEGDGGATCLRNVDLNKIYKSRLCVLCTLGRGRGTALKKSNNLSNIAKMETGTEELLRKHDDEVFVICTDQGRESELADFDRMEPVVTAQQYEHPSSRRYPRALFMPDHLHIVYNALESAVCGLQVYKFFLNRLRSVTHFLSDLSIRRLFRATCLASHPNLSKQFEYFSVIHVEWRWEYLSICLGKLIPLMYVMRDHLDTARMMRSDDGNTDATVIKQARLAVDTNFFPEFCEFILNFGKIIEHWAHTLEGCRCHGDVWKARKSHKQKKGSWNKQPATRIAFGKDETPCGYKQEARKNCFNQSKIQKQITIRVCLTTHPVRKERICWIWRLRSFRLSRASCKTSSVFIKNYLTAQSRFSGANFRRGVPPRPASSRAPAWRNMTVCWKQSCIIGYTE